MDTHSIFESSLQLSNAWTVESIEWDQQRQQLNITLKLNASSVFRCPICHYTTMDFCIGDLKQWRYFPFFENETYIHAVEPWIQCPTHGKQKIVLPWNKRIQEVMKMSSL